MTMAEVWRAALLDADPAPTIVADWLRPRLRGRLGFLQREKKKRVLKDWLRATPSTRGVT